jgi:predicted metalloendopeptidase
MWHPGSIRAALICLCMAASCAVPLAADDGAGADKSDRSGTGVDTAVLDESADPCEDFYQYACGRFDPRADAFIGGSANIAYGPADQLNRRYLDQLLADAAAGKFPNDADATNVGALYRSCRMPNPDADADALKREFVRIDRVVTDRVGLARYIGELNGTGAPAPIQISKGILGHVKYAPLGADALEYFHREALVLLGTPRAQANSMAMASVSLRAGFGGWAGQIEERSREELAKAVPEFDWDAFFASAGVAPDRLNVVIDLAEFRQAMTSGLDGLRAHLKTNLIEYALPQLELGFRTLLRNSLLVDDSVVLGHDGATCAALVKDRLREPLGRLFARVYTDPAAQADVRSMTRRAMERLGDRIASATWLDADSRAAARDKAAQTVLLVGAPAPEPDDFFFAPDAPGLWPHLLRGRRYEFRATTSAARWQYPAYELGAWHTLDRRQIEIAAALFARGGPYYRMDAPAWSRFGVLGFMGGHEVVHGFGAAGSRYDALGRKRDWLTPAVRKTFDQRTGCFVEQWNAYRFDPRDVVAGTDLSGSDLRLNGQTTLEEDLADEGGLDLAYRNWRQAEPAASQADEQSFFLAFAQWQCTRYERVGVERALGKPNSPPRFRVNGTLSNFPAFAAAFRCTEGKRMVHTPRCALWSQ